MPLPLSSFCPWTVLEHLGLSVSPLPHHQLYDHILLCGMFTIKGKVAVFAFTLLTALCFPWTEENPLGMDRRSLC